MGGFLDVEEILPLLEHVPLLQEVWNLQPQSHLVLEVFVDIQAVVVSEGGPWRRMSPGEEVVDLLPQQLLDDTLSSGMYKVFKLI